MTTIINQNYIQVRPSDTGYYIEVQSDTVDLVDSLIKDVAAGVITLTFNGGKLDFTTPTTLALTVTELDINIGEVSKKSSKKEKESKVPATENEKAAHNQQITEMSTANQKLRQESDEAKVASESKIAELEAKITELNQMLEQATAPAEEPTVSVLNADGTTTTKPQSEVDTTTDGQTAEEKAAQEKADKDAIEKAASGN